MKTTRILVVDDHPFFRNGVICWLRQQEDLVCCGEAGSIAEARVAVAELRPDLVLLDLHLKDGDGMNLLADLSRNSPSVRVVVLSQFDEDVFAHRALLAGARGYVMKSEATDALLTAIQTVTRGEVYVSRMVSARLLHNMFPDPAGSIPELNRLSDRELQVFRLLGARCSNREISARLKISSKTVETYREHLKEKLALADAEALLAAARRWVERGEFNPSAPEGS